MELKDIRDYIKTAGIADKCYIGKLNSNTERCIGVYQLSRDNEYRRAIGNRDNTKYWKRPVNILIHWSENAAETESAAQKVYDFLENTKNITVGENVIEFILMHNSDPIDLGTDDRNIYEMSVQATIYYSKKL